MEPNVQTAFIPKKPLTDSGVQPQHSVSFVSLISTIVFVTVLAIGAAVYGYSKFLTSSNGKLNSELDAIVRDFDKTELAQLNRVDNRIEIGKVLLSKHTAPSLFFKYLERHTVRNVRFGSFSYTASPEGEISVTMDGQANSFAAVAAQVKEFSTSVSRAVLADPVVSNINLDKDGNITFSFKSTLNQRSVLYSEFLKASGSVPATPTAAATTTAQTASTTRQ